MATYCTRVHMYDMCEQSNQVLADFNENFPFSTASMVGTDILTHTEMILILGTMAILL